MSDHKQKDLEGVSEVIDEVSDVKDDVVDIVDDVKESGLFDKIKNLVVKIYKKIKGLFSKKKDESS